MTKRVSHTIRRRVELLDTSVLLNLLRVPFESDQSDAIEQKFSTKTQQGIQFRLPAAAIVEAGDHVGRIADGTQRRECAQRLEKLITATLDGVAPWAFEPLAWDYQFLRDITSIPGADLVSSLSKKHLEMGDLAILAELGRLRANLDNSVVTIAVWTLDAQLESAADSL